MDKWISVEDRLPKYSQRVLINIKRSSREAITEGQRVSTDSQGEQWESMRFIILPHDITHWMPLPEPPSE